MNNQSDPTQPRTPTGIDIFWFKLNYLQNSEKVREDDGGVDEGAGYFGFDSWVK